MKIKLNYKKVENNNNNKAIIGLNNFKIQNAYIDQDGNYFQSKGRFETKYSLYIYIKNPRMMMMKIMKIIFY